MSGSACARALAAAGREVTVFDKARGSGGRLASRRIGEVSVNIGAQVIPQAASAGFRAACSDWLQAGLLCHGMVGDGDGDGDAPALLPNGRLSALTRACLQGARLVTSARVARITPAAAGVNLFDDQDQFLGEFEQVVLTAPAPQALILSRQHWPQLAHFAEQARFSPAWVAVVSLPRSVAPGKAALALQGIEGLYAQGPDPLHRGRELFLVVADAVLSADWLEREPELVGKWLALRVLALRMEEACVLATGDAQVLAVHRWRYARVVRGCGQLYAASERLWLAGDWLPGGGIEAAWSSGDAVARALLSADP